MARAYCAECGAEVPVEEGVCFFGHPVAAEDSAPSSAEPEPAPEAEPGPEPVAESQFDTEAEPEPESESVPESVPGPEAVAEPGGQVDVSALEDAIAELEQRDVRPEDAEPAVAAAEDEDYALRWEQDIGGSGTEPSPLEPELGAVAEPEEPSAIEPERVAEPEEPAEDPTAATSERREMEAAAAAAAAAEAARDVEDAQDVEDVDAGILDEATALPEPQPAEASRPSEDDFVWEQDIPADESTEPATEAAPTAASEEEEAATAEEPTAAGEPETQATSEEGWDLADWDLDAPLDSSPGQLETAEEPTDPASVDATTPEPASWLDLDEAAESLAAEVEPEPEEADLEEEADEEPEPDGRRGPEIDVTHFTARDRSRGGRRRKRRG